MNYCTIPYGGGLGNQLFQLFTLFSHAIDNGLEVVLKFSETSRSVTQRPTYWDSVFSEFKNFSDVNVEGDFFSENDPFIFSKIPSNARILFEYFQSYKYFQHNFQSILEKLKIKEKISSIESKFRVKYLTKSTPDQIVVAMHFRLGDYKHLQQYHPILSVSYYKNAVAYLRNNIKISSIRVLCFCEKEDLNLISTSYLQFINADEIVIVDDKISDWEQMFLMSCCDWNVIANSAFSWWGAYFKEDNSKTIYPSRWFLTKTPEDLMPANWISIRE